MDLNLIFYKLFKFSFFFTIVYILLSCSLKNNENYSHILRLVLIIVLLFVIIDCYYPTISYE